MAINGSTLKDFLQNRIEPLEDPIYGKRYRASARLTDGTYLPCVVFQGARSQIDLALRRFKQLASRPEEYEQVVASFTSKGSRLADWVIDSVEPSPYAWPVALLKRIHGETTMGWTAFVVQMTDGSIYSYGTSFSFEFFDLPTGYTYNDIADIRSGVIYTLEKGVVPYNLGDMKDVKVYRDRPDFTCYLDGLV